MTREKAKTGWDGKRRKEVFQAARRVVVKVGSGVLTIKTGLNLNLINGLALEISEFLQRDKEVILVSSGAIAAGMKKKGMKKRPTDIPEKQAAAALGQADLIREWEKAFERCGKLAAQVLLTRDDLSHRKRYLNARNTLRTLLDWGVVPVINENDTVVVDEIKFGDNDNLAAMIALLMNADVFVNLTDIDGLYEKDPKKHPEAEKIDQVARFTKKIEEMASGQAGDLGMGGMESKVMAAKKATAAGIPVVVTGGEDPESLTRVLNGEPEGTFFVPNEKRMASRKCWLGFAVKPKGRLVVDKGAEKALMEKGKSLLPIGIKKVQGKFSMGEPVEIESSTGETLGVGLSHYDDGQVKKIMGKASNRISRILGQKPYDEVVHRDNFVVTCES